MPAAAGRAESGARKQPRIAPGRSLDMHGRRGFGPKPLAAASTIGRMVLQKHGEGLDDSLRLWRYMSFDRFVHLLATETLWLAALSCMEDKREGTWIEVQASKFQDRIQQSYDYAAAQTVVSSWIAADEELLPMWDSYAPADTGIAVSTDVHSLIKSLAGSSIRDDGFDLMRVQYCDQPHPIPVTVLEPFWPPICAKYKSRDFRHENEVRVVYSRSSLLAVLDVGVPIQTEPGEGTHIPIKKLADLPTTPRAEVWTLKPTEPGKGTHTYRPIPLPDGGVGVIDYASVDHATGTYVKIKSIRAFMKNGVHVSPRANPWMIETVKSVMRTYGHDPTLARQSALTHLFEVPASPPFPHNITYE